MHDALAHSDGVSPEVLPVAAAGSEAGDGAPHPTTDEMGQKKSGNGQKEKEIGKLPRTTICKEEGNFASAAKFELEAKWPQGGTGKMAAGRRNNHGST